MPMPMSTSDNVDREEQASWTESSREFTPSRWCSREISRWFSKKQEALGSPAPSEGPGSWQGVRVMDKFVADCVPLRKCLLTPASSGSQRVSTDSGF